MKIAFVALLLAASALAQDQAAITAAEAACGPSNIKFDAKQDSTQHPTAQPDPDKAVVYIVQDTGLVQCKRCVLTKVGMDGAWVGANHGSSYFFFSAEPGEHHLCVNWQSSVDWAARVFAFSNFVAEPGKIYYFRARIPSDRWDNFFDSSP